MPGQSPIRFNLMMGWCCLLSIAVVIMAIVLATTIKNQDPPGEKLRLTDTSSSEMLQGSSSSQPNHILLVSETEAGKNTWVLRQSCFCQNTSLTLEDSTVTIKVAGFYHTYAQVTLSRKKNQVGTVTFIANENTPGRNLRKIIEAPYHEETTTISMSRVIRLELGETVKLDIMPNSTVYSQEESQTYWGLFLLEK